MKKYLNLILILLLVVLAIASIFIGVYDFKISEIFTDPKALTVLLSGRIPRVLAVICTGVGMSIAGFIMQTLCRNKFVSPSTTSTLASAQLGVLVTILVFGTYSLLTKTIVTFVFALAGTWLYVFFINRIKIKDVIMVPLIGIMFGFVIGGIVTYLAYRFDLMQALAITLNGSFSLITAGKYEILFLIIPLIVIAFLYSNVFNIAGMGENFSKNLGVNYKFVLFLGLTICALITTSVVVIVGSISYIGLIIPNIVSMFQGDKVKKSMITIGLFGAVYLLICDIISKVVIFPFELPIDLISGIIGSILFIYFLLKRLNVGKSKGVVKNAK